MDFVKIRQEVDPISSFNQMAVIKESSFLFCLHEEPRPFGQGLEEKGDWLFNEQPNVLLLGFKELVLRELLFEDYVNGDAVPALQPKGYDEVLSLLLVGAQEGEFDGFHGGIDTLKKLKVLADKKVEKAGLAPLFKEYSDLFAKADLNLKISFYESKDELNNLDGLAKAMLQKRLSEF
jgi:hypothetical protein